MLIYIYRSSLVLTFSFFFFFHFVSRSDQSCPSKVTEVDVCVCVYVCVNENKAGLLTLADFCSAAQTEFPIRGNCTGGEYQRSAAPQWSAAAHSHVSQPQLARASGARMLR